MRIRIAKSQIPGAGMGLYLMQDAEKNDRIARYSGRRLNHAEKIELDRRGVHIQYCLRVHKNLYLDSQDSHHFEGLSINDAKKFDIQKQCEVRGGLHREHVLKKPPVYHR